MKRKNAPDADSGAGEPPHKTRARNNRNDVATQVDVGAQQAKSERKAAARQAKSERRSKKRTKLIENAVESERQAAAKQAKSERLSKKQKKQLDNTSDFAAGSGQPSLSDSQDEAELAASDHAYEEPVTDTAAQATVSKNPPRFVCFVGNLPYTATTSQITSHFSKLTPLSIRHSTDKLTRRGKGFAFLEFDNYDKMKTCLKLYHHSMFDPDGQTALAGKEGDDRSDEMMNLGDHPKANPEQPKTKPRRINVELTAGGGGGKSDVRKEKIKTKNKRLEEQRERTRVKDTMEKDRVKQGRAKHAGTNANKVAIGKKSKDYEQVESKGNADIHPSRLTRVPHSR